MNKLKANPRVCPFSDVKVGELFRILRPDVIGVTGPDNEPRLVKNEGLYAKCSTTIAVDIAHDNKDIIPTFKIPCRVMPKVVDISHLETYRVCNRRG